jgi:outer membrane protein
MRLTLALAGLALLPVAAAAAPEVLTLERALTVAREHQPQLRQARAATESARARADQARASLLPQVEGSAVYSRSTANYVARPGSLPSSLSQQSGSSSSWTTAGFYNLGVSLNQLVWDFGASSSRWGAAKASAASQQESERGSLLQTLTTVRVVFFQVRAAKGLVAVASQSLENQDRHLKQVEAFVEVGTKPAIDLAQSRADRANALVQLINAQNAYETAKAQLNQAMGVEGPMEYDVSDDTFAQVAGEEQGSEALLAEALGARPDVAAAERAVRAQTLTLRATRASYWPSLTASTGLTDQGGKLGDLSWNWNASLNVSVPLFRGGATQAQVREGEWGLEAAKAQADAARQQVRLDVEQARLAVRAAKATLDAAGDALVNAQELLRLAEGRYETGVGSIIELGDAQVRLTTAAQQKVQAEYTLATARAQLIHAIGRI